VRVADEQSYARLPPARLRRIVRATLEAEGIAGAQISVAIVSNAAIRTLNRRHLGHDRPTDVLSFSLGDGPDRSRGARSSAARPEASGGDGGAATGGGHLDGEIILSGQMAAQAAKRFPWDAADELALYLVHGLLHLCGYDDDSAVQRRLMRAREREILAGLGIKAAADDASQRGRR
jgi:probable rRNA maturation factor